MPMVMPHGTHASNSVYMVFRMHCTGYSFCTFSDLLMLRSRTFLETDGQIHTHSQPIPSAYLPTLHPGAWLQQLFNLPACKILLTGCCGMPRHLQGHYAQSNVKANFETKRKSVHRCPSTYAFQLAPCRGFGLCTAQTDEDELWVHATQFGITSRQPGLPCGSVAMMHSAAQPCVDARQGWVS